MNKQRILAVLFTAVFLALLGCKTTGNPPPNWFESREGLGTGP